MPTLLFKLRNVPDDEIEEVRKLLEENNIEFYETSSGRWGLGMPGIWVREPSQYQQARLVLDQYQEERSIRRKERYEQQKKEGRQKTFFDSLQKDPIRFVLYIAIVVTIAYLSIKPFINFLH